MRRIAKVQWRGDEIEVALDDVDRVGQFVELEFVTEADNSADRVTAAREAVSTLAAELRIGQYRTTQLPGIAVGHGFSNTGLNAGGGQSETETLGLPMGMRFQISLYKLLLVPAVVGLTYRLAICLNFTGGESWRAIWLVVCATVLTLAFGTRSEDPDTAIGCATVFGALFGFLCGGSMGAVAGVAIAWGLSMAVLRRKAKTAWPRKDVAKSAETLARWLQSVSTEKHSALRAKLPEKESDTAPKSDASN